MTGVHEKHERHERVSEFGNSFAVRSLSCPFVPFVDLSFARSI